MRWVQCAGGDGDDDTVSRDRTERGRMVRGVGFHYDDGDADPFKLLRELGTRVWSAFSPRANKNKTKEAAKIFAGTVRMRTYLTDRARTLYARILEIQH